MQTYLTRATWLAPFQRLLTDVDTPLGKTWIQNLNEAEYMEINCDAMRKDGKPNPAFVMTHRRRIVAAVVCDLDGQLLFDQPGDIELLKNVHAGLVSAVYTAAVKHCGLGAEEDAEKNSEETSVCDSPAA